MEEITALYHALQQILLKAIAQGGSSFKDYHHLNGDKGHFQKSFKVYAQEGKTCLSCKVQLIQRVIQQGRSTFYCAHCQQ
jgi:formamidopyrimidine-DNA glycosylase